MLIDRLPDHTVLVVGDVMLDHFVSGSVERVSPEAPALVLNVESETLMLGGAGNVAANINSLGGNVVLIGVVGDDDAADRLAQQLSSSGINDSLIRDPGRRTTEKTRYLAGDRHLLRADREAIGLTSALEDAIIDQMTSRIESCDAVVISDYAKGVVTPRVVNAAVEAANAQAIPVVADPKRRDFGIYRGADVLTPNRKELEFATGESCHDASSAQRAADTVMALTGAEILLTRSEDGVSVFQLGSEAWHDHARAPVVRDVSGAGDTVLAACALALAAGADLREAAHLANVAAAVAVSKSGTATVSRDELNLALAHSPDEQALVGKLMPVSSASTMRQIWKANGMRVGFTNGCFDLLHPGHIQLLEQARSKCDRLIVALNTDASVSRLKGPSRPVQSELSRAEVIGAVRAVDLVLLFDEDTPENLIRALRPDVLIKGADYSVETVVGSDLVLGWGGDVELIDLVPAQSTSRLIARSIDGEA